MKPSLPSLLKKEGDLHKDKGGLKAGKLLLKKPPHLRVDHGLEGFELLRVGKDEPGDGPPV